MRKLTIVLFLAGAVAIVGAQAPAFEVATVKANKSGDTNGNLRQQPGGRVQATNMPLRPMITFAFQLAQYQLVGAPGWIATDRFDIVAKLENAAAAVPLVPGAGPGPMQLALQGLLADRFKMKSHRETRQMDIYELVMAKPGGRPGPNLKPSAQDCAAAAAAAGRGAPPPGSGAPFCGIQANGISIRFGGLPASQIASALSGASGRMVVDRTGLTGAWDFDLTYAPEQSARDVIEQRARGGDGAPADSGAASFFTAVQEQLGLKLESTKGSVDVLVIDSVEHPTDD